MHLASAWAAANACRLTVQQQIAAAAARRLSPNRMQGNTAKQDMQLAVQIRTGRVTYTGSRNGSLRVRTVSSGCTQYNINNTSAARTLSTATATVYAHSVGRWEKYVWYIIGAVCGGSLSSVAESLKSYVWVLVCGDVTSSELQR